jgi:DnaK suppressor protein
MKGRQSMKTAKTLAKRPKDYRMLLLAKRAELSSSLRAKLDTLAGTGGAALEDLAPVFSEQFTALRINRLDYLQLKQIDAALARLNSEEYGVCVDCGDAISRGRLEAIPWALRCVGCQELVNSDNDANFANDSAQLEEMSV